MKKSFFLLLFAMFFIIANPLHADVKDGEYNVNVSLLNAYEDIPSMGAGALAGDATLYVSGGAARLRVHFVALNTMEFKGFLGELQVNGAMANVVSTYPDIDAYNDPENGIDAKMKGRQYPRVLEFPIDLNTDIFPCVVYVPVMQEMGLGAQKARIQVTYPKELFSAAPAKSNSSREEKDKGDSDKNTGESKENGEKDQKEEDREEEASKEETFFLVNINLWHSVEDKPSMGNDAMTHQAVLRKKDGKMSLYIGSAKMKVSKITTSLANLFYDNGSSFVKAKAYSYKMKIEGKDELRPEVFSLTLKDKSEFLNVLVDPKVEPMGDDPIKARLKIDFAGMKEISKKEAGLYNIAMEAKEKPKFDPNKKIIREDKGIKITLPPGTFKKDFDFVSRHIRGEELNAYKENFDPLDTVIVYELKAFEPLNEIPYDAKRPINAYRKSLQTEKTVTVSLPVENSTKDLKLYSFDKEAKELNYKSSDGKITFESAGLGSFILVTKKSDSLENTPSPTLSSSKEALDKGSMENRSNEKSLSKKGEGKGFVLFFIFLILLILIGSLYFIKKYLKILKRELYYGEELKLSLNKKHLNENKGREE